MSSLAWESDDIFHSKDIDKLSIDSYDDKTLSYDSEEELNIMSYRVIGKKYMECPICGQFHEIEQRKRTATLVIKEEEIEYEEIYYYCSNAKGEAREFEIGKMTNANLLNARNEYRKRKNLLTSEEIVELRERYGLSQVELARLLGWGEATISRYESKAIQDEAYDNMLRIVKDNPLKAIEFLEKNREKFTFEKRIQIREKLIKELEISGKEFLSRQTLQSEYVLFSEPSDLNGNVEFNIDKVEGIVSYYADKIVNLYKNKLMKMLWYADTEFYRTHGRAMTGLVYTQNKMGAVPVGYNQLINLENINVQEEEDYEGTKYRFLKNDSIDISGLAKEEIEVLDKVVAKFERYTSKEIVEYVCSEKACNHIKLGEIIPFEVAKDVRTL